MKKLIDIPEDIMQDLKILAVKHKKDLKNFIQDELRTIVNKARSNNELFKNLTISDVSGSLSNRGELDPYSPHAKWVKP